MRGHPGTLSSIHPATAGEVKHTDLLLLAVLLGKQSSFLEGEVTEAEYCSYAERIVYVM